MKKYRNILLLFKDNDSSLFQLTMDYFVDSYIYIKQEPL